MRINCITPNPEIIKLDPNIDSINLKETFYSIDSSYWELIVRKDNNTNIINHNLEKLGISEFEYKSEFYFTHEEKEWASKIIDSIKNTKKIINFSLHKKQRGCKKLARTKLEAFDQYT